MKRIFAIIDLFAFYVFEVIKSNIIVARDVLGNQSRLKPGFVEVETGPLTEIQTFWLANLITMTPGTLAVDVYPERRTLLLHTLYSSDPDEVRRQVANKFERRITAAL
ncbi:MAG: Na+/H+ antiporter subunit E [Verrucomicrobiota bacterium]